MRQPETDLLQIDFPKHFVFAIYMHMFCSEHNPAVTPGQLAQAPADPQPCEFRFLNVKISSHKYF